jgi:hypothetical protein
MGIEQAQWHGMAIITIEYIECFWNSDFIKVKKKTDVVNHCCGHCILFPLHHSHHVIV